MNNKPETHNVDDWELEEPQEEVVNVCEACE